MMRREDLRVHVDGAWGENALDVRPPTDAEVAELIESEGWVKRPDCRTCEGKPLAEGDEPDFDGPCPSCAGTGFGRLVALDGIDMDGIDMDALVAALGAVDLAALDRSANQLGWLARTLLAAIDGAQE